MIPPITACASPSSAKTGSSPPQTMGSHSLGMTSSGPIATAVRKPSRSDRPMLSGGERSELRYASRASAPTPTTGTSNAPMAASDPRMTIMPCAACPAKAEGEIAQASASWSLPRSSPALSRRRDRRGDDAERKDQLERIVQQRQRAEPLIPFCRPLVLRIDGEGVAADCRRDGQGPFAGRQQQVAAEPLALHRAIDGETTEAKDRHLIAAELLGQCRGDAGERDGAGADRVEAANARRRHRRHRDKNLGAAGLVILSGVAIEVFVELARAAIEALAVMMPPDPLLAPIHRRRYFRAARRRAAAKRAGVGLGGFSSSSSTRTVSRSLSMMRSARSTTARAAGSTLRMMKLVTSSRS